MPKRLSPTAHTITYAFLVERDGETCAIGGCKRKPGSNRLEIDHIDNNPSNWNPPNLQLACRQCNMAKEHERRRSEKAKGVSPSVRTYACVGDRPGSEANDQNVKPESAAMIIRRNYYELDIRSGVAHLQANAQKEPVFIDFVLAEVEKRGIASKEELLASGAHRASCTLSTARDYLHKLTSREGPLELIMNNIGGGFITLKVNNNSEEDD